MADDQLQQFKLGDPKIETPEERDLLERANNRIMLFDFGGPLSFGAAADLGHHVRERVKNKASAIILDFSRVPFIDVSAARAVETIACDARQAGKTVYITGMSDTVKKVLAGLNADHCLPADTHYQDRIDALRAATDMIEAEDKNKENGAGVASPVMAE